MNKRGIFFTMIVIVLLTLFFVTYSIGSHIVDQKTVQKRVETLNSFMFALEQDLPRQVYIAGFRTVFILDKHVIEKGVYFGNLTSAFEEVFYNGSLNGIDEQLMVGAHYNDLELLLAQKANKINANVTLSRPSVRFGQVDPWHVQVILNVTMHVEDSSNFVSWTTNESIIVLIPIETFEDPLYVLGTNGLVTNTFVQTPFTSFAQGSNVSNLLNHTLSSYYQASPLAPSFLNRFTGNFSSSPYGVESFVNLQELSDQDIIVQDKSVVDYLYFSSSNPSSNAILGMPSWFKLDDPHINAYNLSALRI